MSISKICNDGPSYRVGEAPRATPYGLARLPNIDLSVMYQISVILKGEIRFRYITHSTGLVYLWQPQDMGISSRTIKPCKHLLSSIQPIIYAHLMIHRLGFFQIFESPIILASIGVKLYKMVNNRRISIISLHYL